MKKLLTLGSLFDGIGGWQLAALHAGIMPVWSSEIEAFPLALTARRFPWTRQLGDISKIDAARIEPVDIVCAGSPCQDLSVAGRKEGLSGKRSGLFREAIRVIRRLRAVTAGRRPRFFVWENVPGAFGSNGGNDFRLVLQEIAETEISIPSSGRWATAGMVRSAKADVAWRVLDAQFWGVPQRRKRIFLVADFGAAGRCADEILFERQSLSGDIAPGGKAREGFGAGVKGGAGNTGHIPAKARALTARADGSPCLDRGPEIIAASFKWRPGESAYSLSYSEKTAPTLRTQDDAAVMIYDPTHADEVLREVSGDKSNTLNARMGTGGNQVPLVAYSIAGNTIDRQLKNGGNGRGVNREISFTLNTIDRHAVCVGNGQTNQGAGDKAGALDCMHGQQDVMTGTGRSTIHRYTPKECERLQGLPDNYTLIADKTCSDAARYKALGNGMAQPCADWIIKRIAECAQVGHGES